MVYRSPNQLSVPIDSRWFATKMSKILENVPEIDIDKGEFKYMLFKLVDTKANESKTIIRGYISAAWHDDIYEQVNDEMKKYAEIEVESLGGGRIMLNTEKKTMQVYGLSYEYGIADHGATAGILKKKYPDYFITYRDDIK